MANIEYYTNYELLFSLRKEYLKNQEIINKLLSYVKISDDPFREYEPNFIFKENAKEDIDNLLLIISKRQSCIKTIINSLYYSLVECDPLLDSNHFLYIFRLSENYIYLLDGNQDGRYLNSNVSISNPKEFIELYRLLINSMLCKKGSATIDSNQNHLHISNNGIRILYSLDKKKYIKMDYDGIGDTIRVNNPSYMKFLMESQINKDIISPYFKKIIDSNMEDYVYTIDQDNSKKGFYEIENNGPKLVLKPNKDN